jgi:predicted enzyme related to lactoylglutathione lyase
MTNRTYPQGVPCWVDTEQSDVEAATEFYGGIFGWTFEDAMPPGAQGRYVIAKLDGQDVGAIAGPRQGAAAWSTYVSVDDADAAAQRLLSAGATVRSAPADAGEGGRSAVLTDPEGIEFRIWQARRRLGRRWTTGRVHGISAISTPLTQGGRCVLRGGLRLADRRPRLRDDDPPARLW